MKISAIITGATGMVGEGVLHECLQHPDVEKVLVLNRRPGGVQHPKLTELIHQDMSDLSSIRAQLTGYNACYFCLGVTSVGKKEPLYRKLTYDLTLGAARTLLAVNPQMTFSYVSGAHTDSSEKGNSMWARVKGKTENDLLKLGFAHAYMFRPGYLTETPGLKNAHPFYKYLRWLVPVLKRFFPNAGCSLKELGLAMIHVTLRGYSKNILEVSDILHAAIA